MVSGDDVTGDSRLYTCTDDVLDRRTAKLVAVGHRLLHHPHGQSTKALERLIVHGQAALARSPWIQGDEEQLHGAGLHARRAASAPQRHHCEFVVCVCVYGGGGRGDTAYLHAHIPPKKPEQYENSLDKTSAPPRATPRGSMSGSISSSCWKFRASLAPLAAVLRAAAAPVLGLGLSSQTCLSSGSCR